MGYMCMCICVCVGNGSIVHSEIHQYFWPFLWPHLGSPIPSIWYIAKHVYDRNHLRLTLKDTWRTHTWAHMDGRRVTLNLLKTPTIIHESLVLIGKSLWCKKKKRDLLLLSKPGFSNTWIVNFQMFKLVLGKAEEPEIKSPTCTGSWKKEQSSRKTSISALLTMPKPLTVWITINCGKFWKRWEYQTTWPASSETSMQVRKQQVELDIEQQTGSK